ncbi:MAG TPA: glycosyl hydrolase family 28 protein, partial [Verrucomicrobiae bacterium]
PNDTNVIYLKPGFHTFERGTLDVPSGKTLYLAGGAVVNGTVRCRNAENVRIMGRGILYQGQRGVEVINSTNVIIDGLIFINPTHYTVYGGQSKNLTIKNIRAFSDKGWSDGIDLMSCSDVLVDGVFMRNSDDCIALYGHRWNFYGDATNITVQNSTLWADVAHPILIGTHGDPEHPDTIGNIVFTNIDILNHDEPQIGYQGCMSINVSDENLARDIRFENIRVEDFEQGQLVNLRVAYNKKYAHAPGRGIQNILFKDITYNGSHANPSIISGYNETRAISNVVFENLVINGQLITDQNAVREAGRFHIGEHVEGVVFRRSSTNAMESNQK